MKLLSSSTKRSVAAALILSAAAFGATAAAQLRAPRGAASAPAPAASHPAGASAEDAAANAQKAAGGALAAAGWLVLLDRRDWGRAWETSSGVFRSTVPLATWMDGIPKVREPLGKLVERSQAEAVYKTTLQGRPDGEYASVIFDCKFENKQVQEIVTTVREPDGKWRVTGYSTR